MIMILQGWYFFSYITDLSTNYQIWVGRWSCPLDNNQFWKLFLLISGMILVRKQNSWKPWSTPSFKRSIFYTYFDHVRQLSGKKNSEEDSLWSFQNWLLSRGHDHLPTQIWLLSGGHDHLPTQIWLLSRGHDHLPTQIWLLSRGHDHLPTHVLQTTIKSG
jgi:hypothetical protein